MKLRLGGTLPVVLAAVVAACGAAQACGVDASPASPATGVDAAADAPNAPNDAGADDARVRNLSVVLDPTLDEQGEDASATSLTSGALLGVTGTKVATAVVVDGALVFPLKDVPARDYFIVVNGIADRLVPTRVDESTTDIVQRLSRQLRASYVGPPESPLYRFRTYPDGPVVQFSDEAIVKDAHAYAVVTYAPSKVELLVLGSASPLTSLPLHVCLGHPTVPADAWLLNTTGKDHHGDTFNADGGAENCAGCHANYWMKKPSFEVITPSRGWCFRCHDGIAGSGAGFVDPSR